MKKTTTKKATKPAYIVDLATPISDTNEIPVRFIEGKVAAGKVIPDGFRRRQVHMNYFS